MTPGLVDALDLNATRNGNKTLTCRRCGKSALMLYEGERCRACYERRFGKFVAAKKKAVRNEW